MFKNVDEIEGSWCGRDCEIILYWLLSLVGVFIVCEGFGKLGVNVIFREVGVDKVLVYCYFGGMEGLFCVYVE